MIYINKVADLFLRRCKNAVILSPRDYALIAEWEKQQIPVEVVFDSINQSFDKLTIEEQILKIKSLDYFNVEIKKNFLNWLQMLDE
jgi:hypothetical protein